MQTITSTQELEALYGTVNPVAVRKVLPQLSPNYERWIKASRFVVLTTVGPDGTDASPRGDTEAVVRIVDANTLLTAEEDVCGAFERESKRPRTVIVVTVTEVYFQCAKALMRSGLWTSGDESEQVPTAGAFIAEVQAGFDAEDYDAGYAEYAKDRMW